MMKTVVLGLGNILKRDEGIGIVLLKEMEKEAEFREYPMEFIDGGTASFEALYKVQAGDLLIVLDAVKQGKAPPGTLYVLKPEDLSSSPMIDTHQSNLIQTLNWLKLERRLPEVIIFAVEISDTSWAEGLSRELNRKLKSVKEKLIKEIMREMSGKIREQVLVR